MEIFWDCFLSSMICHIVHFMMQGVETRAFLSWKASVKGINFVCVCVPANWCCVLACYKVIKSRVFGGLARERLPSGLGWRYKIETKCDICQVVFCYSATAPRL